MRRFDKNENIRKANILAEQRYLESKGLLKENFKGKENKEFISKLKLSDLNRFNNKQKLDDFIKTNYETLKDEYDFMLNHTFDNNMSFMEFSKFLFDTYKESQYLNSLNLNEESTNLIKEEQFTDLFKFLAQDPKKMTQGSAYYVADLNTSMNKNIVDDEGNKIPNPMYGKLYKHTRFLFKWEDTYSKAMDRVDPEHVPGKRSGTYEKVQGYDVLETGKSGLYLPIIPTGSEYQYVFDNNGNMEVIDKETVKKYLRPMSPSTVSAIESGKPAFRPLIIDKVAKITGGGNVWENPNFKGVYMGPGSNISETNISEEKGINNIEAANQAFLDMKPEIDKKQKEEGDRLNPYGVNYNKQIPLDDKGGRGWDTEVKDRGDSWVPSKSHVYTKDSKRLNREL